MLLALSNGLIAAVDAVDAYRNGMYGEKDSGMTRNIVLGAVVIAVVWGVIYALDKVKKSKQTAAAEAAKSLFADLASSHRLSAEERTLLESAAKKAKVSPPEAIFITPEDFETIAASNKNSEAFAQIRKKVYGDALPA